VLTGLPLLQGACISLKMRQPNTDLLVALPIVGAYVYGRSPIQWEAAVSSSVGVFDTVVWSVDRFSRRLEFSRQAA